MFCSHCRQSMAPEANFCPFCGTPAHPPAPFPASPRIVRPRHPRAIAGICAGFALHFGWDVLWTRVIFAALTLFTSGLNILVYLALWVILPDAQYTLPPVTR